MIYDQLIFKKQTEKDLPTKLSVIDLFPSFILEKVIHSCINS